MAELVSAWCPSPKGIAVARNGEVVPKSTLGARRRCSADDRIEIVTAAAGG